MSDETPRNPAGHLAAHRWPKGTSGNPGGRPRGRGVSAALRDLLAQDHSGREVGELLAELMLRQALRGNLGFVREVLDRAEGRAGEEAPAGGPLVFNFIETPSGHRPPAPAQGGGP